MKKKCVHPFNRLATNRSHSFRIIEGRIWEIWHFICSDCTEVLTHKFRYNNEHEEWRVSPEGKNWLKKNEK